MSVANQAVDQVQYLTFYIAGEEYAVGILRVREILEYDTLTRVPKTPPYIRGVINLRGNVVPVIDLAVKFGLGPSEVTKLTCVVILEVELDGEPTIMGVLADSVSQVIELASEDIQPAPSFGTQVKVDYLLGMGQSGKKFVLILDVDRVLSTSELTAVASLSGPADDPETGAPTEKSAQSEEAAQPSQTDSVT